MDHHKDFEEGFAEVFEGVVLRSKVDDVEGKCEGVRYSNIKTYQYKHALKVFKDIANYIRISKYVNINIEKIQK